MGEATGEMLWGGAMSEILQHGCRGILWLGEIPLHDCGEFSI